MPEFIHLHVHSHYSLLDSTVKLVDLTKRCAELGMKAVALTDHGNLCGAIELQKRAGASGIRSIIGAEVYLAPEDSGSGTKLRPHHLVLLAENLDGYRNLTRLVSAANLGDLDRKGRAITRYADLERFAGGLIALTGDLGGEIPQALLRGERDRARAIAGRYVSIFGQGSVYVELQRHAGIPEQSETCDALVELARAMALPIVATNNVHYLRAEDFEAHGVLLAIGVEKRLDRSILSRMPLRDLHLRSPEEMAEAFADLPEALAASVEIAERCRVEIPTGENYLPSFDVPEGHTEATWLADRARAGLQGRVADAARGGRSLDVAAYSARLDSELEMIGKMKFPGYFLIVWDFIRWAREHEIPVGPGRGSGAGSLVAWALRITDVNPIPYGLLFERFLNPERVSMPDFDIDFCQDRRGEVIDYVTEKYGSDRVAQIVTFGQLKAKAVVRDVARVLNMPLADADRLAKLIPNEVNIKLADAIEREPQLREAIASSPTVEYLCGIARALEGNNRNHGVHAAGIVIGKGAIEEYVPVMRGADGSMVTQFGKDDVELAGLVKFDFLGLRNLTVVQDTLRRVNRGRARDERLDLNVLGFDDPAVYDLISRADTGGLFQMESEGFQRLMRQLRPDRFEDIIAAMALYRPGPLGSGMVEKYVDCKHGRRVPEYPHPLLEPVLRETWGVMVYQEQVMKSAQVLAGYTLGGADLLRRAMGKKKPEEMAKQRETFVKGCAQNGIAPDEANHVFDLMAKFADYGFNKSHSAAYAVLAYHTAYLKAHHPIEFLAALMTSEATDTDRVVRHISNARARGIRVLPPDVNASESSFTVTGGAILFGLGAVKGIGGAAVDAIVEARSERGFESFFDFCERIDGRRVNRKALEVLIRCGALDTLAPEMRGVDRPGLTLIGKVRARMFDGIDIAVEQGVRAREERVSGQASLLSGLLDGPSTGGTSSLALPNAKPWDDRLLLAAERETLGFYVSGHPLDRYSEEAQMFADSTIQALRSLPDRTEVRLAGTIGARKERVLKSGEGKMATLVFEDRSGAIEAVVYSRNYRELEAQLASREPMLLVGTVREEREGENRVKKLAVSELQPLAEVRKARVRGVTVEIDAAGASAVVVSALAGLFATQPGNCEVTISVRFPAGVVDLRLPPSVRVAPSDELVSGVAEITGERRIRFR